VQPLDMVIEARTTFGSPILRELVIIACWIVWKTRNGVIFGTKVCNLKNWKSRFKEELGFVCIKAKQNLKVTLDLWRENFS